MTKYQKYYRKRQEDIRGQAIEWQYGLENANYSYSELVEWTDYFRTMGRRYGLLREFEENAVI